MQIKFLEILKPYKVRFSYTLDGNDLITKTGRALSRNPDEAIDKVLDEFIGIIMTRKTDTDKFRMVSVTVQEVR